MSKRTRMARISIDIGESTVKIAKISKIGTIIRAGAAKTEWISEEASEKEHITRLSGVIKRAAKTGKIAGGECVLVTGGAHIIVRHFIWPDMPPESIKENAQMEIAPFLPGGIGQFQISSRIIGRSTAASAETGKMVTRLDVLVAAMEKKTASILKMAAKRAGFSVKRIDIRENAREKLTENKELWSSYRMRAGRLGENRQRGAFSPTGSFVILDMTDSLVNMSVFIRGMFYANRYFGANLTAWQNKVQAGKTDETADEGDELANSLAAEAASIIDYVHYQERGSEVRSILLLGGAAVETGFTESFAENLDIPVVDETEALNEILLTKRLKKRGNADAGHYLDAYGAAHIVGTKNESDIDLRNRKQRKGKAKRLVPIIAGAVILLGSLIFAGIYFPKEEIGRLEAENHVLDTELNKYTVTETDLQSLRQEIESMRQMTSEITTFQGERVPAQEVIRKVYGALPTGTGIYDLVITGNEVNVRGTAANLGTYAKFLDALKDSGMFEDEIAHSVGNIQRSGDGSRLGFTVKPIEQLYEDGAVDYELTLRTADLTEAQE